MQLPSELLCLARAAVHKEIAAKSKLTKYTCIVTPSSVFSHMDVHYLLVMLFTHATIIGSLEMVRCCSYDKNGAMMEKHVCCGCGKD